MGVNFDQNEKQDSERPQRWAAITEKGQGDPNYGEKPDRHSNIHYEMQKENGGYTVAVNPAKSWLLPFSQMNNP